MSLIGTGWGDRLGLDSAFDVDTLRVVRADDVSVVEDSEESLIRRRQFDFWASRFVAQDPEVMLFTAGPADDTTGVRVTQFIDIWNPRLADNYPQRDIVWWNVPLPESRTVRVLTKSALVSGL